MKFQLLLTLLPLSASFLAPPKARSFHLVLNSSPVLPPSSNQPFLNENENENEDSITSIMNQFETAPISALLPFAALLVPFQEVMAKGGEYGILEGRIGSMLHPVTMLLLFATSLHR